jgi:hypothetical protein
VEDEWFLFYVLITLTQRFSELTVKVRHIPLALLPCAPCQSLPC